ncbi:MAG: methylmalonyl-CoA mutase [Azospirillum sp.]|nr:methylmalonyl-CoA mutase [Azospirillum sp.]
MNQDHLVLAGEFGPVSREEWLSTVEKALKGVPFDKKLVTRTYEGFSLQPIYTRSDWPAEGDPSGFPGMMPFTRGGRASGHIADGWDIRQLANHPGLIDANQAVLADLEHGVTSLLIRFDAAGRLGLDGDGPGADAGQDGVMVYSLDDLDTVLAGVDLTLAPVALSAGGAFVAAAAMLAALWRRRGVAADQALGAFNADPLGALAATGSLPAAIEVALAQTADLAALTARTWPQVTAVAVDTTPYHDAGASEAQDLGCAMATAVAYLRALTGAGMAVDDACRQIAFTFAVGCDQFLAIAKLRAARRLWARIAEASGASEPARAMRSLHGITASRIMTRRDPWVNMLRTTITTFAAGVAGADSVTSLPYDAAVGLSDAFARRIARNSQVVLQEESYLTRVIDPAGGSWYVESLTDQLAARGWAEFQAIEQAGGMVAALTEGMIAGKLAATWAERAKNVAKRRDAVTGVNEFPNISEKPVVPEPVDLSALRMVATERLGALRRQAGDGAAVRAAAAVAPGQGALAEAAIAAARAGATLGTLSAAVSGAGQGAKMTALPKHHLAEDFEALRDAGDALAARTGSRPKIFLANLGAIAKHTGRATFAKNFFESGGIEAVNNDGFSDPAACAEAFKTSGARVAILCGTDPQYLELVASFAPALKAAGASYLFLAGAPGDNKAAYSAAGVDDYIFMGGDVLGTLRQTLTRLGVI